MTLTRKKAYKSSNGKKLGRSRVNPFEKKLKPEQLVQKAVVEFLKWYAPTKKILWFHCPSEIYKTAFDRYLWDLMGSKDSVSDLIFLTPSKDGKYNFFALELKTDGQRLLKRDGRHYYPKQEAFLQKVREAGGKGEFACGKDQAITMIKDYFG